MSIQDSSFYRFFRAMGNAGVWVVPLALPLFAAIYWYKLNFESPLERGSQSSVIFTVENGWDIKIVAEKLAEQKIIKNWMSVYYLSRRDEFKKTAPSEMLAIVSGEYHLSPGMKPREVLTVLISGQRVLHPLVIEEVTTVKLVAQKIADSGLASLEDATTALEDQALMRELAIPAFSPEGYLAPGSYEFSKPTEPRQMVKSIIEKSTEYFEQSAPGWRKRAEDIAYSPYEMLTLASMLEKDASNPTEQGNIASVYHNRLRIGMHLQSDSALGYSIPNFNGKITQQDIAREVPYNTYRNTGLPPTPICTPSIASLKAALKPSDTDFLYFVDPGNGETLYAATFGEHKENLKKAALIRAQIKAREAAQAKKIAQEQTEQGQTKPEEPSPDVINEILSE